MGLMGMHHSRRSMLFAPLQFFSIERYSTCQVVLLVPLHHLQLPPTVCAVLGATCGAYCVMKFSKEVLFEVGMWCVHIAL